MSKIRSSTKYINKIIEDNLYGFWKDNLFLEWMPRYTVSSFATDKGYLQYSGSIRMASNKREEYIHIETDGINLCRCDKAYSLRFGFYKVI